MTTSIFDVSSLFRTSLQAWWTTHAATLAALGTPIIAYDDGSPASTATGELPVVVVRLGDASISSTLSIQKINQTLRP